MKNFILNFTVITIVVCLLFAFGCEEEKAESQEMAMQDTTSYQDPLDELIEAEAVAPAEQPQMTESPQVVPQIAEMAQQVTQTAEPNVLVTVNGVDITEAEVNEVLDPLLQTRQAMGQEISESVTEMYKSRILDDLITSIVFEQQLEADNIAVTQADVNDVLKNLLSSSNPPMTMEEFSSAVASQGMTLEQWSMASGFHKRIQFERMLNAKDPNILLVTEADARNFYDENPQSFNVPEQARASHILISTTSLDPNDLEGAKLAARAEAEALLRQAREGTDFAELAKENSDDKRSAPEGGDIGYFSKASNMPEEFLNAAFGLQVGQISDVVEAPYGYHIIKLTDRKDPYVISYEDVSKQIIYELEQQKLQEAAPNYIEQLKEDAEIVYPAGSTIRAYQPVRSMIRTDTMEPSEN